MQRFFSPSFWQPSLWRPYFVLVLALVLTGGAVFYASRAAHEQDQLRFDNMADQTRTAMDARLSTYIAVLRGGAGLISASNLQRFKGRELRTMPASELLVGRAAFHNYVSQLRVASDFPGIQGVGFSVRLPKAEQATFLSAARREDSAFHLWPNLKTEAGPDWHSIVYLEPLDKRNRAAIGFNMYSEPTRRAAMQQARDSGNAATSGKVFLKQEITQNKQAGFLIYVPVYRGAKVPSELKERRAALLGFVYSPFRTGDFFQTLLDSPTEKRLRFQLYDGQSAEPDTLLYQSASAENGYEPKFQRTMHLEAAGRAWTLKMQTRPRFNADSSAFFVPFIAGAGLLVSALLFGVTWTEAVAHARAEQTARKLKQSEEKREELLQSERDARRQAEEASQAKDEFLAVVSHELRTPLTSILGWASLLRGNLTNAKDMQRGLQTIERNAQAQAQLIEDLLDMSRIVSGRLRLETEPIDLIPILDAALDAARPAAQARNIQLWQQYQTNGAHVLGDAARLQQIVWNLLTNAIKFTPPEGKVELLLRRDENQLEISITDSGIGMDADFVPRAFDRFQQADSSATRSHGGLGLGLAIVRNLAEMHGGAVQAHSEGQGQGSTFTVRLPLLVEDQPTPAVTQPMTTHDDENEIIRARLQGRKILVVEDDSDSRQMIETLLQIQGAEVQAAGTVPAALQIFASWQPDILVSDIGLPGEDGYALLRHIRALPVDKGGQIPAIALTALARDSDRIAAQEAGFQRHLTKPISPIQLAAAVALLLSD